MGLEDFLYPSARNILVWSGLLFVALLFLLPPEGAEVEEGTVETPATGLVTLSKADCGDLACTYPETQLTCPSDCRTAASISSLVQTGGETEVAIEFEDWRYRKGQKVLVDLTIEPEGVKWTSDNGCIYGGFDMGPRAEQGVIAWPSDTVSEDGRFKTTVRCRMPEEIDEGLHTVSARTTMIF